MIANGRQVHAPTHAGAAPMGAYSHLVTFSERRPPEPGEHCKDGMCLMARYHLPAFWLALFTAKDIVPRRYWVVENDEDVLSDDDWPYLVAEKASSLRLLESRSDYLMSAFSSDIRTGLRQFIDFLSADRQPFVQVCTLEIGSMVCTAPEWRSELQTMLSLFGEPAPRLDGDPDRPPQFEALPPGWRKYTERMTARFRNDRKIDMNYFAGESEAVRTVPPWDPGR
jgi:hypothetical protein